MQYHGKRDKEEYYIFRQLENVNILDSGTRLQFVLCKHCNSDLGIKWTEADRIITLAEKVKKPELLQMIRLNTNSEKQLNRFIDEGEELVCMCMCCY